VRLADRMGVPCYSIYEQVTQAPLISARLTELEVGAWQLALADVPYDLFIHDWAANWYDLVRKARRVYAANPELADLVRQVRSDVTTLFCPSSLVGNPDRGQFRVLTYGMAHKLTAPYYEKLRGFLDYAHPNYTVSLSTAVHEGSPWEESLRTAATVLRDVFGERLRVLGYVADDALAREIRECDCVALFYNPALRSNNTTAWAALEAGAPLVTNTDDKSPPELSGRVMNISAMRYWPFQHVLKEYGERGQKAAQQMSWERLVGCLRVA
jgi:hypothetical protein